MNELRVWAPLARRVRVRYARGTTELDAAPDGWWTVTLDDLKPGDDYAFLLDNSRRPLPDPRSRWQPYGVHGASRVYDDSTFAWTDERWPGRELPGAVIYELHVGTFTPGATFDAAAERLGHLVEIGRAHV